MEKLEEKNISYWLSEGNQSKLTPLIKKIAGTFNGSDIEKIVQILDWEVNNISKMKDFQKVKKIFASRTVDKIIKDKFSTGCHDDALIAAVLLRALGIPAKYLTGIDRCSPWSKGHCVVEAYIKGSWVLVDASHASLFLIPQRSDFYKDNIIVSEGLDSWDNKIKTIKDWEEVSRKVVKSIGEIKL